MAPHLRTVDAELASKRAQLERLLADDAERLRKSPRELLQAEIVELERAQAAAAAEAKHQSRLVSLHALPSQLSALRKRRTRIAEVSAALAIELEAEATEREGILGVTRATDEWEREEAQAGRVRRYTDLVADALPNDMFRSDFVPEAVRLFDLDGRPVWPRP